MRNLLILLLVIGISGSFALNHTFAQSSTVSFSSPVGDLYYEIDSIKIQVDTSPSQPNTNASFKILDSSGVLIDQGNTITNGGGTMVYLWSTPTTGLPVGIYTVEVTADDGASGENTFEITDKSTSNQIDFQVDKNLYQLGDTIAIQGTLTPSIIGQTLDFRLITPDNKHLTGTGVGGPNAESFPITTSLQTIGFQNWFEQRGESPDGTYTLIATYGDELELITFEMVEELDVVIPVVIVPNNISVVSIDGNPLDVSFSVSATDNVDGTLTPTCSYNSGDSFPIGTTTVTCTATDAAGNSDSESFNITLTYDEPDTIPPVIVVPSNMAIEATSNNPSPVTFSVTSTDDTDGTLTPTCSYNSGHSFPIGLTTVTCTATDNAGNAKSESFTITVTYDQPSCGAGTVFDENSNSCVLEGTTDPTPDPEFESKVTIIPTPGSGAPGCEETSTGCFIPETAYVRENGKVVFSNTDSAAHTFTAGGGSGLTGEFDTGLLMAGSDYEYFPDDNGEIPYYCMVHPWMQGLLVVGGEPIPQSDPEPTPDLDSEFDFETRGMKVLKIEEDHDFISILFSVDVTSSTGLLEVTFERDYFDSTYNGKDDEFIVLADGNEPSVTETYTNSKSRTLKIELREGTEEIEIIGSQLNGSNDFPNQDTSSQLTVKTNRASYENGDTIVVSGFITNLAEYSQSVTMVVVSPIGDIVSIMQVSPTTDGKFSTTIKAGATMNVKGDYEVRAQYGSTKTTTTFYYSGGSSPTPQPEPEPYPEQDDEVTIIPTAGSGAPGCEETSNGCYLPEVASIAFGGTVIMKNTDSAAHTFTAGTPGDGPTGEFDTGLLMRGGTFEWTANEDGAIPYFCMVHPWMEGLILVGDGTSLPPSPEPSNGSIDLEIEMENRIYDINSVAVLEVSLSGTNEPQNVAIDVTDPRGTTVISRSSMVDPDMGIGFEFKITENFKPGNYKVTATTSDGTRTVKDTTHFKVKSQFNSFKITSVQVTDQKGNPSNLEAGEIGFIKVNLESNKSIATLMTVNIFDAELTSIGIGSINTTLSSGGSEIILSFNIPDDAAIGPADVYVNAFSDWPSSGGVPLTTEVSITENIE